MGFPWKPSNFPIKIGDFSGFLSPTWHQAEVIQMSRPTWNVDQWLPPERMAGRVGWEHLGLKCRQFMKSRICRGFKLDTSTISLGENLEFMVVSWDVLEISSTFSFKPSQWRVGQILSSEWRCSLDPAKSISLWSVYWRGKPMVEVSSPDMTDSVFASRKSVHMGFHVWVNDRTTEVNKKTVHGEIFGHTLQILMVFRTSS